MLKNNFLVLLFLAVMVLVSCSKNSELIPNTENSIGTSGKAIDKLAKGINLTNWFNDYSDRNQLGTRYTTAHFNQIKNAGFTYVQLPIGPLMISDANNISSINSTSLTLLDQAVKKYNFKWLVCCT
jgi:aryl-phospho-beta-D-glucosidase BglC (GH1 family)